MRLGKKIAFLTLVTITYICCTNVENNHKHPTKSQYSFLDSISCDSSLYLLVQSADIPLYLKNMIAKPDGIENDTLLIKISHENEAESGAFVDAADGFLSIDMKNKKLYYIIIETDSSKEVKCDQIILDHYILHCLK